jgi:hypothetical protein
LLTRISRLPGVEAVGLNTRTHPLPNLTMAVEVSGDAQAAARAQIHQTNAGHTKALGISLLQDARSRTPTSIGASLWPSSMRRLSARGWRTADRRSAASCIGAHPAAFQQSQGHVRDHRRRQEHAESRDQRRTAAGSLRTYTLAGISQQLVVRARDDAGGITKATLSQIYAIDSDSQRPMSRRWTTC